MEKETKELEQRRSEAERLRETQIREEAKCKEAQPSPNISPMEPVTRGAYGGGIYGTDSTEKGQSAQKPPASETQSADAPFEFAKLNLKHTTPPSTGDRDIDITGQSYIQ